MSTTRRAFLTAAAVLLSSSGLWADEPAKKEDAPKGARMLMVTQSVGFKHGSVNRKDGQLSPAERAITELGVGSNLFRVDCTQDVAKDFTKENLQNYDLVFFYTTGDLPISDEAKDYFFNTWLKQKGRGFIGAHSAADTFHNYKPYWDMIGGTFDGHPWGSGDTVTVDVIDPNHPISKVWDKQFSIKDEIYQFKNWQPEKVRVLMSLNIAKSPKKGDYIKRAEKLDAYLVPIAWCKTYGEGKCFHMSLGHNEAVWADDTYMKSMLGGIKWILNQEEGDATPNPEVSAELNKKAKAEVEAMK